MTKCVRLDYFDVSLNTILPFLCVLTNAEKFAHSGIGASHFYLKVGAAKLSLNKKQEYLKNLISTLEGWISTGQECAWYEYSGWTQPLVCWGQTRSIYRGEREQGTDYPGKIEIRSSEVRIII